MLLKKRWKCYKKKTDKGTNNNSWIKQGKSNNYSPKAKEKTLRTKNGRKQFKFDLILEKIPDKNDVYYIEHREGTNASRLRKDPKKTEKDELITMLETINRAIKRPTSKSKLSQLKRIIKHLVKKYKDLGEEFIE